MGYIIFAISIANGWINKENAYLFTVMIQEQQAKILFDDSLCSKYISDLIKQKKYQTIVDPCLLWKCCKNSVEIDNMIEGHVIDGIAVVEFLSFLANEDLSSYSEYDLGLKLTEFCELGRKYVTDSFPAIIGFKENGAIIHYRALQDSAKKITGNGLLLIDSVNI